MDLRVFWLKRIDLDSATQRTGETAALPGIEDSQSSNPGAIPGSATNSLLLSPAISYACYPGPKRPGTRRDTWGGTVEAKMGHNLGHSVWGGGGTSGSKTGGG